MCIHAKKSNLVHYFTNNKNVWKKKPKVLHIQNVLLKWSSSWNLHFWCAWESKSSIGFPYHHHHHHRNCGSYCHCSRPTRFCMKNIWLRHFQCYGISINNTKRLSYINASVCLCVCMCVHTMHFTLKQNNAVNCNARRTERLYSNCKHLWWHHTQDWQRWKMKWNEN